jgi:hypothetical protein
MARTATSGERHMGQGAFWTTTEAGASSGIALRLRRWLETRSLDDRARYLAAACDHADLERRIRLWDETERSPLRFPYLP